MTDRVTPPNTTTKPDGGSQSTATRLMTQFDELPPDVRAAVTAADHLSDQMFDILYTMHRSGFPQDALLKVIAASNAKSD